VNSLPPGEAAKLLPPEVIKMAAQVRGIDGGENTSGRDFKPSDELNKFYAPLRPKTKDQFHDQSKDLVHKKSTLDYIPPDER
jgi:hypothetical protein